MPDDPITNLGNFRGTEDEPQYRQLYEWIHSHQFSGSELRSLEDHELVYIAGHRAHVSPPNGAMSATERWVIDQKVIGNALRAQDELQRRSVERQLQALEESNRVVVESNRHMRKTATATQRMAFATIATAAIAAVTLVVSVVVARSHNDGSPSTSRTTATAAAGLTTTLPATTTSRP